MKSCQNFSSEGGSAYGGKYAWLIIPVVCLLLNGCTGGGPILLRPAGQIIFDQDNHRLLIVGYSQESPCTLDRIRQANTTGQWNILSYDAAQDTTRIEADLEIGNDQGRNTYLQIGRRANPRETLALAGNLTIKFPRHGYTNQLQLGVQDDRTILPRLAFDCRQAGEHRLLIEFSHYTKSWGSLKAYHGAITAYQQDADHAMGQPKFHGDIELQDTELSWCAGSPAYGLDGQDLIAGVTFANSQAGVYNFRGVISDCIFSNLTVAVQDGGGLEVEFVRCVFAQNQRTVSLAHDGAQAIFTDCDLQKALSSNLLNKASSKSAANSRIIVRRSFVVKVTDGQGNPINNVLVDVVNEAVDGPPPEYGAALTDANGLTPAARTGRAIRLVESIGEASSPCERTFSYRLIVTVAGRKYVVNGITPENSWYGRSVMRIVQLTSKR